MTYISQPYDDALKLILDKGTWKTNKRTGIKCLSYFGITSRYPINEYFPIVTKRKIWPKSIFAELLWFISGSTNTKDLEALGSKIWNPWRDETFEKEHGYIEGSLGPVYGFQLRHYNGYYGNGTCNPYGFGGFDQLRYIIDKIKEDPTDRRIMFNLWNPEQLHRMRLPPCHYSFQISIDDDKRLSGLLIQRSADYPIGICLNIGFYSALTIMIAQQTGYMPHEFIHTTADSHIYENQIDAVNEYLSRPEVDSPKLEITKAKDIYSYKMDDFNVINYNPLPIIKIPVAV